MALVVMERDFTKPLTAADMHKAAADGRSCMDIYRVRPLLHYLARDGARCTCLFEAPDAEAMRNVIRTAGLPAPKGLWSSTVFSASDDPHPDPPVVRNGHVLALVDRQFERPVTFDEVQAVEDAGAACLTMHRVRFLRTYFATDRQRMICLYDAPDVESVRVVNRQVGLPYEAVWGASIVVPTR
jgi:hypothetical protein